MSERPASASASIPTRDDALAVLLLEDSKFDAELLREALAAAYPRATLEVVRDEAGFREALQRGGWAMILSDYEIPGFGGEVALSLARESYPHTPFIFVSGVIGEDNAVEMLKRGATDYVSKGRLSRLPLVMERALQESAARAAKREVERRLREANDIYQRVVNSLRNYAVILMDTQGRITSWNDAAQDIFRHSREEMLGQDAQALFTPEDRQAHVLRDEMKQALQRGMADDNRWMQRADGLQLWAEGVLVPLYGDDRRHTGFCKVVRDATSDYRDAEALRSAKEQAEQANEVKDRFLAILSHELRTPLTPISTAAHLLEQTATVPEKYSDLLPMIRRNVALEARLIDDLLDLTAISAGKVVLKVSPVDVHGLVQAVARMLGEQVEAGGLKLELKLDAERATVNGDPARLQQVLWNLLRNAVKFTPRGGTVTVRTSSNRRVFRLDCIDTGIGIDHDALPSIFNAFEQADREVTRTFGGLGLGLAIARGLVTQHEGELVATSQGRGKGSTFTLQLPLALTEAEMAGDATAPGGATDGDGEAQHVLFVEDNIDAAETMQMMLEAYGWRVSHAPSCADALRMAQEEAFDVVLTDLGLPDGSGIDVGRALSPKLPVIALSGYGAAPDFKRSAMAGFAAHLVKPADPRAVHKALKKAISDRQPH